MHSTSKGFRDIKVQCLWVTTLTFYGHVTLLVTWPSESQYAVSYTDIHSHTDWQTEISHGWSYNLSYATLWQ